MKGPVTLIAVGLICFGSISQIRQSSQNPFWELQARLPDIEEVNELFGDGANSVENIQGSPYDNEEFVLGSLYINDKISKKHVYLRYNIYVEEIEIKTSTSNSDDSYSALLKDPEIYAKIGNTVYIFAPFLESIEKGGYFSLIEKGHNYNLYQKSKVEFVPYKNSTAYTSKEPAKFLRKDVFYFVTKDGKFFKLPNSKSKILKVMDDHKEEVKDFIKTNEIDLDNKNHIVKLFKFYDSLIDLKVGAN